VEEDPRGTGWLRMTPLLFHKWLNSASWQHLLQPHVELSVHLQTWFAGRSPQCRLWSGAYHMSSLMTVSAPTCTERLCRDPGLCGSGLTKTTNSKEDQSLFVGWWDPPLWQWHGWLSKLIAIPLSTVCSCPQVANLTRWDVVHGR